MSIDLEYEDHQIQLGEAAREVFRRRCAPDVIRELRRSDTGHSAELWREMAELGWLGITIDEAHGGGGAGFADLYPIYEEMGRAVVPSPHLDTVAIAADLIGSIGSDAQRAAHLPAIAAGECIVAFASVEADGGSGPGSVQCTAVADGDGWVLTGVKTLVAWSAVADRFLVTARTSPGTGADGVSAFLVDAAADGIDTERLPNIGSFPLAAVHLDGVRVDGSDLLGSPGAVWEPLSATLTKAAVLQNGTIVGAARAVLDMTNQYAKDRRQFGVAIGSYQAVQYMVSDILIDLHAADLLTRQAVFRIDTGRSHRREAHLAIAHGKAASAHFHRQAHEVFAGVAFIDEHDLTLYSLGAKYWEMNLGDARYHEALLASLIIDRP